MTVDGWKVLGCVILAASAILVWVAITSIAQHFL